MTVALLFLLAPALQSRAHSLTYFLSGALIAAVPVVVFGAVLVVLFRIYRRTAKAAGVSGSGAEKK